MLLNHLRQSPPLPHAFELEREHKQRVCGTAPAAMPIASAAPDAVRAVRAVSVPDHPLLEEGEEGAAAESQKRAAY